MLSIIIVIDSQHHRRRPHAFLRDTKSTHRQRPSASISRRRLLSVRSWLGGRCEPAQRRQSVNCVCTRIPYTLTHATGTQALYARTFFARTHSHIRRRSHMHTHPLDCTRLIVRVRTPASARARQCISMPEEICFVVVYVAVILWRWT